MGVTEKICFLFLLLFSSGARSIQSRSTDQIAAQAKMSRENGQNSDSDKQDDSSSSDQVSTNTNKLIETTFRERQKHEYKQTNIQQCVWMRHNNFDRMNDSRNPRITLETQTFNGEASVVWQFSTRIEQMQIGRQSTLELVCTCLKWK